MCRVLGLFFFRFFYDSFVKLHFSHCLFEMRTKKKCYLECNLNGMKLNCTTRHDTAWHDARLLMVDPLTEVYLVSIVKGMDIILQAIQIVIIIRNNRHCHKIVHINNRHLVHSINKAANMNLHTIRHNIRQIHSNHTKIPIHRHMEVVTVIQTTIATIAAKGHTAETGIISKTNY